MCPPACGTRTDLKIIRHMLHRLPQNVELRRPGRLQFPQLGVEDRHELPRRQQQSRSQAAGILFNQDMLRFRKLVAIRPNAAMSPPDQTCIPEPDGKPLPPG